MRATPAGFGKAEGRGQAAKGDGAGYVGGSGKLMKSNTEGDVPNDTFGLLLWADFVPRTPRL